MKSALLALLIVMLHDAEAVDDSKEIEILWGKYGDVKADVETLKAQFQNQQDIEIQLNDMREEMTNLKNDVQMLKGSHSEDKDTQTPVDRHRHLDTSLKLEIHKVSMSSNDRDNSVIFSVDYNASVNIPVKWKVNYDTVYDGNTDFITNTFPHENYYRSTMTTSIPPEHIIDKRISVNFLKIQARHPVDTARITISFNTSDLSAKIDNSIMRLSYEVETVTSEDSFQKALTFMPDFADLEYEVTYSHISYVYLNETDNKMVKRYAFSYLSFNDAEEYKNEFGGVLSKNITERKEDFKVLVTLNNSLRQYGGDMYANIGYNVRGSAIREIRGVINLDYVFTEGVAVSDVAGKFAVNVRNGNMDIGSTGYIDCSGWGYPAPSLQITKVNADNTTTLFPYREAENYQTSHNTKLTISVQNVTQQMEGNYACIGMVGGVTKKRVFHVDISVPGKFDNEATVLTKYPNGKVMVNISASGDPIPDIDCMENERSGYNINFEHNHYNLTRFENPTESRVQLNIQISSAYNSSRYEPLKRIVCSASRNYGRKVDDWLTVLL